jgi:hypothetical protein
MGTVKDFFKKLATRVCVIVLIVILFTSVYSLFIVKNNGYLAGLSGVSENWEVTLKEAEKVLASNDDVITWDGITYKKAEFEQKLREAKQELNGQFFVYRLLKVVQIVLITVSGFCLFLIGAWPFRCKKCKKWFAVQKRDMIQTQSEKIYTVVENKTRSAYTGEVTATTEQHIPGKRNTYKTTYVCKYCGAEKYKYKTADTPNT